MLVDNRAASQALVDHLIADGHRSIAVIVGPPSSTTGHERLEGYIASLQAHWLPVLQSHICQGTPTEDVGEQSAAELLDRQHRPTAIFAGNNALAAGALRAIRRRKLRIPDDVALVAFDEVPWMSLVEPQLTVIHQPIYEIGRTAAHLLLERIAGSTAPPKEYILPATLRVRQSCANHGDG